MPAHHHVLGIAKTFGYLEWRGCILLVGGIQISMAPRLNCGRMKSNPCRCLHLKVWNLCICCVTWQRKRKIIGWIKIADQLALSYRVYSGWSRWAQWYHKAFLIWRWRPKIQCQNGTPRERLKWSLLPLKMEGARNQGMWAAYKLEKPRGEFSPRSSIKEIKP